MKTEDEVPPFEADREGGKDLPTPKSEYLSETTLGLEDETQTLGSSDDTSPVYDPQKREESEPTQGKNPPGRVFFSFFFILLLTSLAAAVYFLEERRTKALLPLQQQFAQLELRLGALEAKGSGKTKRDVNQLQQEFQAFREQVSQSLAARPTSLPNEEQTIAAGQVAVVQGIIAEGKPEATFVTSDDLQMQPNRETAAVQTSPSTINSVSKTAGEGLPQAVQLTPSVPASNGSTKSFGKKLERTEEAQKYIDFVESTAADLFELVKKGSRVTWDYLLDLLG